MKSCCSRIPATRVFLFFFNVLLMFIGAVYIGVGAWLVSSVSDKPDLIMIEEYYRVLGLMMAGAGLVSVFLSVLGYFVSVWPKLSPLLVYAVVLVVVFLFCVACGFVGFFFGNGTDKKTREEINRELFLKTDDASLALIDDIQVKYKCCGVNGSEDWTTWIGWARWPVSCCLNPREPDCNEPYKYPVHNNRGCEQLVSSSVRFDMHVSGGLSLAIALPMILGLVTVAAAILETTDHKKSVKQQQFRSFRY